MYLPRETSIRRAPRATWLSWRQVRLLGTGMLAVVLLGGCVIRVAYNQLDWLALWYMEDYFELDASQEQLARDMIGRTLGWHRETQLPQYASLTRSLLAGTRPPVDPEFLAARYADVVTLWDGFLGQLTPDLAVLLRSLSDEQVKALFSRLARDNAELAEDFSGDTAAERRAKQDKSIIRAFRRFTGRLTPAQEVLIRTRTARFHDLSAEWLARRATWQAEFRRLLEGRRNDPAFEQRLGELLLNPDQFDGPGYRELVEENRRASFVLVAVVLDSLSAGQRRHLDGRLTTFAEDFEALVRSGGDKRNDEAT